MCRKACQLPKLLDQVRLLDGLLTIRPVSVLDRTADFDSARRGPIPRRAAEQQYVLGVCRIRTRLCGGRRPGSIPGKDTQDFSGSIENHLANGGVPCLRATTTNRHFFETMNKRRKGYPSETQVKRGVRIVHGDKLLEEKLGRNDPCPCGSGKRFKKCCLKSGCF